MKLLERFLKYVSFDTQSDPDSDTVPSTSKQLALLNYIACEMVGVGLVNVEIDPYGYVMGTLEATVGYEDRPVIGLIAHVDTSPDMPGADVKPRIIENYDGGDIKLNESLTMKVSDFPELSAVKGHTIITTDGTTLLGADDKAGIAEIITAAEYLAAHPEIPHGKIRICITPDEEIGRGVDHLYIGRFGANYAYTVDGGAGGEIEYENFNAAGVKIDIQGRNIHPGYAKDKMINALSIATELDGLLPAGERPEFTEGYEGFFHLTSLCGTVEHASMEYIIRDHSDEKFREKKALMERLVAELNKKYGEQMVTARIKDQYYNMRRKVELYPEVIEKAKKAIEMAGITPVVHPIRGGTDGARLSFLGLPCPNLFTGGMNFHGKYEYASLDTMQKAVETIVNLVRLWGE